MCPLQRGIDRKQPFRSPPVNRFDEEAYARALADKVIRAQFHRALSAFSRALTLAVASRDFLERTPSDRLARWRKDEARFVALRAHVRTRYADAVEWSDYERRIRDVLDRHVTAHEVVTTIEPLSLFDDDVIAKARAEGSRSEGSIADEIAHRTLRVIEERWDEDPVFFDRFSKLVRATIDGFRRKRLDERSYLDQVRHLRDRLDGQGASDDAAPQALRGDGNAAAFWGISRRELGRASVEGKELPIAIAQRASAIVEAHRKMGWHHDRDVQNRVRNALDDFFFDEVKLQAGGSLSPEVIDTLTEAMLAAARARMADDGRYR